MFTEKLYLYARQQASKNDLQKLYISHFQILFCRLKFLGFLQCSHQEQSDVTKRTCFIQMKQTGIAAMAPMASVMMWDLETLGIAMARGGVYYANQVKLPRLKTHQWTRTWPPRRRAAWIKSLQDGKYWVRSCFGESAAVMIKYFLSWNTHNTFALVYVRRWLR